jgi:predicted RNase H-like nuclease (RuvC/YqgF family)
LLHRESVDALKTTVDLLHTNVDALQSTVDAQNTSLQSLQDQNTALARRIDQLEHNGQRLEADAIRATRFESVLHVDLNELHPLVATLAMTRHEMDRLGAVMDAQMCRHDTATAADIARLREEMYRLFADQLKRRRTLHILDSDPASSSLESSGIDFY